MSPPAALQGLEYLAMERALNECEVSEETREKVRSLMQDPEVVSLYRLRRFALGKSLNWKMIEQDFFEMIANVAGDPPALVKKQLRLSCQFLGEELIPSASEVACRLLGVDQSQAGVDPRSGEGRRLKSVNGIEVRSADVEWKKEDGIYVGTPHKEFGSSIYHQEFVSQLDKEKMRISLADQHLYVGSKDLRAAEWLIQEFGFISKEHVSPVSWRQMMQRGLGLSLSVSLVGVVLKVGIQDRPGELGNLARAFPCCALENFHRLAKELLPLPMPIMTDEELAFEAAVKEGLCGRLDVTSESWKKPGGSEAARIPLSEVVSDSVKEYVDDPSLLRIPDEELIGPRTSALVQVTSQEEWDKIVSHLVDAGMLEREVESETLKYRGEPVRNGAFGVHKSWVLKEDGEWLRTLRLIINMIPGNSFQRRMPVRASEKMGYAPLWGNLYLHEDEIIICAAEDQKRCFHIYRPGYAWQAFFSLSRMASGQAFKDGKVEKGYPRVKSAPMGWNNVVDFIQDGFENMAKMAGLAPNQVIRMGEPSPLEPLATPRSFFSFYVDNFDIL